MNRPWFLTCVHRVNFSRWRCYPYLARSSWYGQDGNYICTVVVEFVLTQSNRFKPETVRLSLPTMALRSWSTWLSCILLQKWYVTPFTAYFDRHLDLEKKHLARWSVSSPRCRSWWWHNLCCRLVQFFARSRRENAQQGYNECYISALLGEDGCWYDLLVGIHPTTIAESFQRAAQKAVEFLTDMATPIDLSDRESLLRAASTSLNSKVSH